MKKKILIILGVGVALAMSFLVFNLYVHNENQTIPTADYLNTTYEINGDEIKLSNGFAETEMAPGSASKVVTKYFGADLVTDLNNDGHEDIVFLLTQETGGSGTMFYAVAALNTEQGYIGSDGYFLGDRVAPQNIEHSPNPRHKNVVVVNYVVRADGQPMTSQPSLGRSAYLKLDSTSMMWGIVEPDFEGETR